MASSVPISFNEHKKEKKTLLLKKTGYGDLENLLAIQNWREALK